MRALITGSAGFVGKYLTKELHQEGHKVQGFDLVDGGDVRNYEHVRAVVAGFHPDVIFHLAAQPSPAESVTDPLRAVEINTGGTAVVLEAVRQTGSHARVLIAGTSEEYGYRHHDVITEETPLVPTNPYGASKAAAGLLGRVYCHQYGIPVIVTRAFNHTGPGQSPAYAVSAFARRVARVERHVDQVMTHGTLTALRDYSDVRDIVRAYVAVIDCEPGVYNICSGQVTSMNDIVNVLAELAGRPIPMKLDPHIARAADPVPFTTSHAKITAATGWEPRIDFADTLREMLDWWRERV